MITNISQGDDVHAKRHLVGILVLHSMEIKEETSEILLHVDTTHTAIGVGTVEMTAVTETTAVIEMIGITEMTAVKDMIVMSAAIDIKFNLTS